MKRFHVVWILVAITTAASFAWSQTGAKERASTRGDRFRAVLVTPVVASSSRFVDRDIDYWEIPEARDVLRQLDAEGYDPVEIEAMQDDSMVILCRRRDD